MNKTTNIQRHIVYYNITTAYLASSSHITRSSFVIFSPSHSFTGSSASRSSSPLMGSIHEANDSFKRLLMHSCNPPAATLVLFSSMPSRIVLFLPYEDNCAYRWSLKAEKPNCIVTWNRVINSSYPAYKT